MKILLQRLVDSKDGSLIYKRTETTDISAVQEDTGCFTDSTGRGSCVSIKYIISLKLVFVAGRRACDKS